MPQMQRRAASVERRRRSTGAPARPFAIGSLLMEGTPVRLSGQDTRRGTFGQRHAVLVDQEERRGYTPLLYLVRGAGPLQRLRLAAEASRGEGFEYGYSLARPESLVMWKTRSALRRTGRRPSSTSSSRRRSRSGARPRGVTLLLPHGYEGQGPDHSSARPERFLQVCAQNNMTVAMPDPCRRTTSTCCAGRSTTRTTSRWWSSPRSCCCGCKAATSGSRGVHPRAASRPVDRRRRWRRRARSTHGGGPQGRLLREARSLRPERPASEARTQRHRDRASGAAVPAAGRGAPRRSREVPERGEVPVGAGGAGEPGRVAFSPQPDRPPGPGGRRRHPGLPSGTAHLADRTARHRRSARPSGTRRSRRSCAPRSSTPEHGDVTQEGPAPLGSGAGPSCVRSRVSPDTARSPSRDGSAGAPTVLWWCCAPMVRVSFWSASSSTLSASSRCRSPRRVRRRSAVWLESVSGWSSPSAVRARRSVSLLQLGGLLQPPGEVAPAGRVQRAAERPRVVVAEQGAQNR